MPLKGDANIAALENAERVRQGIALRREGYDWDEIADTVGWASRGAAFTQIERAMRKAQREMFTEVELYRYESLERLRELIKALWPRRADEKVAAEIRRCTERMDKLTGAEPDRTLRIEWGESDVDRALRELDEQITARTAGAAGEAVPPA
jgi:hypothetical protein